MMLPTTITYGICLIFFAVLSFRYSQGLGNASISSVEMISNGLKNNFNVNPLLLLPPIIVIIAVIKKIPALPGIVLGILSGAVLGMILQRGDCTLGDILNCGMNGFTSETGVASIDKLLSTGGINNMLFSVSLTQ